MTRRRRALLLAALSLALGVFAASHVARREQALADELGPLVQVVVARQTVPAGAPLTPGRLAVRTIPERYAPAGVFAEPEELTGLRAAVAVPAGADLVAGMVDDGSEASRSGAPVRIGERVADLVATGSPQLIQAGSHVDVVITRGGDGAPGRAELALEDVEVLAARAAPQDAGVARVAVSLRVTVRQAVFLAAAQSFARDIRLLPRAPGDRRRGVTGVAVGSELGG
ncbi:MAG: Flp pilus assembly protein CpaB [Solirubrobacteraceae bacterium]